MEFRSLSRRLINKTKDSSPTKNISVVKDQNPKVKVKKDGQMDLFSSSIDAEIEDISSISNNTLHDNDYVLIDSIPAAGLLNRKLLDQNSFCFSFQIESTSTMKNIIVGLAFSYSSKRAYYVPLSDYKDGTSKYLEIFRNVSLFFPFLSS